MREAIAVHGGYVFQVIGDAFCAAFSTAEEAVRAAIHSQMDLDAEKWPDGAAIKVRMGIHTGRAEFHEDGEYQGYLAMSRVQRLMSAAHGGQVLLSHAAQELVREDLPEGISLRELGDHRLKDIVQPETIYQLVISGLSSDFPPIKTLEQSGCQPAAQLVVRLLGTFEVLLEGKTVSLPVRTAQSLLAFLMLNTGRPHRREKLAGMFWPDAAEEKARANLRHELWRIRKALPSGNGAEYLIADDMTIAFNRSADYWLDAEVLQKVKDPDSVEDLTSALWLYQGELLPGFYEEWIVLERDHLQALYEEKVNRLLGLLEAQKRWQDVLKWGEHWISRAQGPEAAYRALMFAYDAMGDRAKLAATYRRCLDALHELGLQPSEQTRALAFKRTSKLKLLVPLTSFIGRERELEEVAKLLSNSRLVTLTGSGGVGKTRLAIQVVADVLENYPDGVWFVDLAPVTDPALVPNKLAGALDLQLIGGSKMTSTELLVNYLRSRRALIIFDNCEHLIESCVQLVYTLLTSCEHLSILATSREALRVSGEVSYRVPSLEIPKLEIESVMDTLAKTQSVRLFLERASVVLPGFSLNLQNALVIAKICQRLDGIPLAIELAAARVKMLAVDQILARLDDRFNLLTGGTRDVLPRHQTLRAAIEWSYDLLSEKERLFFRRLAVFVGGWTLEAAEAVCRGDGIEAGEILDLLSNLVDKSLVIARTGPDGVRYRRLETIRQFTNEILSTSGEVDRMRGRHYEYFLNLAEQADQIPSRAEKHGWRDRLEPDNDNFRAAFDAYFSEKNTGAVLKLLAAWADNGRLPYGEIQSCFDRILTLPDAKAHPVPYGRLLNCIAGSSWLRGNYRYAKSIIQESQEIWLALGEEGEEGLADALSVLGEIAILSEEEFSLADSFFEKSRLLYEKHGNDWQVGRVIFSLGHKLMTEGRYEEAAGRYLQAYERWKAIDPIFGEAATFNELGELERLKGDYVRAGEFYERSLKAHRKIRGQAGLPISLFNSAWASLRTGDVAQALEMFKESLELRIKDGNQNGVIDCLAGLAGVLGAIGKPEEAAQLFGASDCFLNSSGAGPRDSSDQADIEHFLGIVQGQLDEKTFARVWALGSEMTIEQAIAFAFKEAMI